MTNESTNTPYTTLILPAIQRLLTEADGSYRCERDLHHHFTACLQAVRPLGLGTHKTLVALEHPARASYGTGRLGNLDYFFKGGAGHPGGTAVELNLNYASWTKVCRDIMKLTDPQRLHQEAVYLAYGNKDGFFAGVKQGIERASDRFKEGTADFLLPAGLHVIVIEAQRGGKHRVRIADLDSPCCPQDICWTEEASSSAVSTAKAAPIPVTLPTPTRIAQAHTRDTDGLCVSRERAEAILREKLVQAGIPLGSTTARCMFDVTRDSHGQRRCKFGTTPLWGNEIRLGDGKALRSEFMEMVQRLCDSGNAHQRAAHAVWGK